jgi:hypothetical protein
MLHIKIEILNGDSMSTNITKMITNIKMHNCPNCKIYF